MHRASRAAALSLALAILAFGAAPALAAPPYVTETCLTPSLPSNQQAPSVTFSPEAPETEVAVFEDDRNGNWDVYARDLWSPWERQVTTDAADQRHPSASAGWIAFEDDRNGDWDIYLADLATGHETRLTAGGNDQLDPAVSASWVLSDVWTITGARVVWEDARNGNWDIYMYDVLALTTRRITSNVAAQVDPAIDGTRVVWADRRNGNWDIYLYDVVKKTTTRLTTNGADQKAPAISGTMVVYQDRRNGNWDIYGYDLATKRERRLTRNAADQTLPAISPRRESSPMVPGWRVVYQDTRNAASGAGTDVYLSDIPAGGEARLTDDPADQGTPAIWGSRVVWADERGEAPALVPQSDVYLGQLSLPDLSADADPELLAFNGDALIDGVFGEFPQGVAGARLHRYLRIGADDRATSATAVTGADGTYVSRLTDLKQTTRYRMVYRGDATHLPAASNVVTIEVKAWLSTPAIPREFSFTKTVTVSCLLKPRHGAGTYPVKFRFYRRVPGSGSQLYEWAVVKTVKGKAADYSTYTKCAATVSFPRPVMTEEWRVDAVHEDAAHAFTVSAQRSFRVTPFVVITFDPPQAVP